MALELPLYGDRILLRPFDGADIPAAHRLYGDAEVMRYVGTGLPVTPAVTAQMVADYRRHQREHGFAFWAMLDRASGDLIGDAGLERTGQGTELGYTLGKAWWGRGLATEAALLCVDAAFGPLGLSRLVALVDAENPVSVRVLTKLGFTADGIVPAYGRPHRRLLLEQPR
ncbi:GNAT family N-acetyltransferase [Brachybacterium sp. UNK5269]|uniref:GNAT family N-acetyltransferase n=1 Tax=Brachybacterium sp. UNK5269 TaxID=3408576 RepID=UPI003BB0A376